MVRGAHILLFYFIPAVNSGNQGLSRPKHLPLIMHEPRPYLHIGVGYLFSRQNEKIEYLFLVHFNFVTLTGLPKTQIF